MKKSIKLIFFGIIGVISIFMVIAIVSLYSELKTDNHIPIEMVAFNS